MEKRFVNAITRLRGDIKALDAKVADVSDMADEAVTSGPTYQKGEKAMLVMLNALEDTLREEIYDKAVQIDEYEYRRDSFIS